MTTVDVLVVTWNASAVVGECLSAVVRSAAHSDHDVTVVVVDNGSSDGTEAVIRTAVPGAVVVRSDENLGFAGGAALGVERSTSDVVVLVNDDAVVAPDFVQVVVDSLLTAPGHVAAVTGHLLLAGTEDASGRLLVNSTGNEVTRSGNGRDRGYRTRDGGVAAPADVFGFCGGAVALRRSALDEVGNFDASLFLYYEDTELSWRLRRRGFTVRYEPHAVVVHRHAFSSGTRSDVFTYHNTRNRLIVATRHAPAGVALRAWVAATARLVGLALGRGDRTSGPAVLRGTFAAVAALPRELRRRRQEHRATVLTRRDLGALVSRP